MNRIEKLFTEKKKNILSIYFTAGYPALNDTLTIIKELSNAGADMIEVGMPFSDPVADGPLIQRLVTEIPLVLMGYINPFFRFGMENFIEKCFETGIDGTIIPDLPVEEYLNSYKSEYEKKNLLNIFMVSPQTPVERILYLESISKGFLYLVATSSTTGMKKGFDISQTTYFEKIRNLNLKTPGLIGFGISDNSTQS